MDLLAGEGVPQQEREEIVRVAQGWPHRLHALAAAGRQDLEPDMLDHRPQALGRDVGERAHRPAHGPIREHQDRAVIARPADMEAVRAVTVDDLAPDRDERRDIHRLYETGSRSAADAASASLAELLRRGRM